MTETVASAVERVRDRVAAAARTSGRDPAAVRIVAVVKGVEADAVEAAVRAGLIDLAENRAKALAERARMLGPDAHWHFVGGIQTNKLRYLDAVLLVHSLDRLREAEALQRRAEAIDRSWDVLVEVNVAGEARKQGISPDRIDDLLERLALYPRVKPRGFMFVAPQEENAEDVRWVFAEGRRLRDKFSSFGLEELSMGMSDDYEVAVEEGATIVRIGRAIFAAKGR